MNYKPFYLKLQITFILFFILICQLVSGQSTGVDQNNLISQTLTNANLYEEVSLEMDGISTYYILDHGVAFNFDSNLKINNKPVTLINKGDLAGLGGKPYFSFHTLTIESSKAIVRVYLSYEENGESKTTNTELSFIKNNGTWQTSNNL